MLDLPKPGTGTRSSHRPRFETGGVKLSCKRWEAGKGSRHRQALCPPGLWLWPSSCPGEAYPVGLQEAATLWGDPGHRPGRRQEAAWVRCLQETEAKPAASSVLRKPGWNHLWVRMPGSVDACFWAVSFLLEALLLHSAENIFFFFYKHYPSISSTKESVHTLDQALVPFRKLVICSSKCSIPWMDAGLDFQNLVTKRSGGA